MTTSTGSPRSPVFLVPLLLAALALAAWGSERAETISLGEWRAGQAYSIDAWLSAPAPGPEYRARLELIAPGEGGPTKDLHAGDPDLHLLYRPGASGPASVRIRAPSGDAVAPPRVEVSCRVVELSYVDRPAIEAEPNDTWEQANPLVLGRDVYGTADDVDYLENPAEGKSGLDWFRFELAGTRPVLVYFQLDLLDRDVSANMKVFAIDAKRGMPIPYLAGKDPMEIVHDRERVRYSKHLSRIFAAGTYYLQVNANHPDYILRTRVLAVPPYDDPAPAVEAGMHYLMNVGDAWFAQVPREGNAFVRSANLHETTLRCTACHASSFPTEANLAAHRYGYPIRSKSAMQYVMDRIANSMTPLYGDDGLYWQRFIAIPLQAQGKQGGILADFEREVTGEPTAAMERFGPFLRAAWAERTTMPPDEQNGVLPLDSKFGIAWRDWRVLDEQARRTGRSDHRAAADHIARILGERAADRRVESLQDRIHRLYAWGLIDPARFANKIRRETGALLSLQNEDGGWHETDGPGPSALYTTGQLVDTLIASGLPRDHPAVARAVRYLLASQQGFGGWFQDTTHENFRTPMRETRYAVMALARVHPRPGGPLRGWGNRDEGPARRPRTDSLVHTLDDLENLWDVPAAERPRYALEIAPILDHPEPLVRSAAAACLGRLGAPEAVPALVKGLGDRSKIVWRASAWALRRLGNRGIGLDAIRAALGDSDPRVRRGAVRIFAYQFHGMDTRLDLADRLLTLSSDPDLWTRLQAVRSLRQWFYRTGDRAFQRRIIDAYLARMSVPEVPVVRKALGEGLYIMLDENLGGGVSLQKNLASLPAELGARVLEARRTLERDVLLGPIFAALANGNELQRTAVLQAFDGSFFRGRSFARRPTSMVDVGNDREFGFLYEPSVEELERAFAPLLAADLAPGPRDQAIALARFFGLSERTPSRSLRASLATVPPEPAATVREASRRAAPQPEPLPTDRPAPGLEAFRRKVNPLFYEPGADGHSCASCHATHSVLRIAEADPEHGFTEEEIRINLQSALKVIDRSRPEDSLLLRKPRSPYGQGEPDPSGPTGLTHVGGQRWASPDHPAYRAILDWIRNP